MANIDSLILSVNASEQAYDLGHMIGSVIARRAEVTEAGPGLLEIVGTGLSEHQPPLDADLIQNPAFLLGSVAGAIEQVRSK